VNTRLKISALLVVLGAMLVPAATANAAPAPHWNLISFQTASNLPPANAPNPEKNYYFYFVIATNVGGAATNGTPITVTDNLPVGVAYNPEGELPFGLFDEAFEFNECQFGPPLTCTYPGVVPPGGRLYFIIPIKTELGAPPTVTNTATITGGGAPTATASSTDPVTSERAPFDFKTFETYLNDNEGEPATQAGSHPYRFSFNFEVNTFQESSNGFPAELIRKVDADLPPGLIVNPAATPVQCAEAQFLTNNCPDASAVGITSYTVGALGTAAPTFRAPLYNLIPPPGAPAAFAFNAAGVGIYVHILGGVDSGDDYSLTARAPDILTFGWLSGTTVELWGDPSDPGHDKRRGQCGYGESGTCPVPPTDTPLLTMPSACSGPLSSGVKVTSWQGNVISATTDTIDSERDPVGVTGCSSLDFDPSLQARPTTNFADSPSGLDVNVHVPQTSDHETLATSTVKSTTITLPEGLVVNPSAANGLDGCSAAEIGMTTAVGQSLIHFSADEPACPDASRIGSVEVSTPLIDDPLLGSAYIAEPYDNPFNSLLAIYIVVNDPQTGVIVKLAGEVSADPQSGQLTTTFKDLPQLPFEDFEVNLFGGAGGTLRTPATCGTYSTTSSFGPWSGTPAETPKDTYAISAAPAGNCASTPAAQPHAPSFDAGTVTPVAGAHSPFVLNLRRNDASQQFKSLIVSPPPGLTAKLAGTPNCPQGAIDAAAAKSGQEELASPSCPAASQVGTVNVAAGAGPAPYNTSARVYMAGPYKGAPLSLAIITPATAGPFDLGTVVVRSALRINPVTAQITAEADPIPEILQGIPLDVRSVALRLDKPQFTLNGTSCDASQVSGSLLSTLDVLAPLSVPFQLGECANLGFKPKLTLSLKGSTNRRGHPALTAVLRPRPGDANLAAVSVALPPTELLDNDHIRTVCTRVQFAADQCPAGSVYGFATVTTPLLDYPLSGNVYLRSSNNALPDLVPDLRGPASYPIKLEAAGRTDTVKGALRNTFDLVPDAPFTKFELRLPGGRKGLIQNSRDICARKYLATVKYTGQNGKTSEQNPVVKVKCPKNRNQRRGRGSSVR
jgi:hypothetical protein